VNAFVALIATETDGVSAGLACSDTYGALTLNVGLAELTGETVKLTVNIRYPITVDFLKMIPAFHEKAQQFGITVSVTSDMERCIGDPVRASATLYGAYTRETGDTEHNPVYHRGVTNSRGILKTWLHSVPFFRERMHECICPMNDCGSKTC
jgi:succinyl-diaminopimelate desuccinylase